VEIDAMKKFGKVLLIFLAGMGYWNFRVYQKTLFLTELSQPFVTACQQPTGCITAPEGWTVDRNGGYQREQMTYSARADEFIINWHISTGVHLIATGGKIKKLSIERAVD
jgi:hypothetical protein